MNEGVMKTAIKMYAHSKFSNLFNQTGMKKRKEK